MAQFQVDPVCCEWRDVFHAGNDTAEQTERHVQRIREQIEEGLALK